MKYFQVPTIATLICLLGLLSGGCDILITEKGGEGQDCRSASSQLPPCDDGLTCNNGTCEKGTSCISNCVGPTKPKCAENNMIQECIEVDDSANCWQWQDGQNCGSQECIEGPDGAFCGDLPDHCTNQENNPEHGETGQDCGGDSGCPRCPEGQGCIVPDDCEMGLQCDGTCQPGCNNECENIDDHRCLPGTDILQNCIDQEGCLIWMDETNCADNGQFCFQDGINSTCKDQGNCMFNGEQDGMETDVDCGGPDCPKCSGGKMCGGNEDCISQACVVFGDNVERCEPPGFCFDGEFNGDMGETDLDCGGPCQGCINDQCNVMEECAEGLMCDIDNGVCGEGMQQQKYIQVWREGLGDINSLSFSSYNDSHQGYLLAHSVTTINGPSVFAVDYNKPDFNMLIADLDQTIHTSQVSSVAFMTNGDFNLFSCDQGGIMVYWQYAATSNDWPNGSTISNMNQLVEPDPNGHYLASAFGPNGELNLLYQDGTSALTNTPAHGSKVTGIAFRPNFGNQPEWLVTSAEGMSGIQGLQLWQIDNISPVNVYPKTDCMIEQDHYCHSVTASADGDHFAALCEFNSNVNLMIYDFSCEEVYSFAVNTLNTIAFNPDIERPRLLFAGTTDGRILLYDITANFDYNTKGNLKVNDSKILDLALTPETNMLAAGSFEKFILVDVNGWLGELGI
jgi:WD40 repeat protein